MISLTNSTHNSTSFICNICLEPPAPTQAQRPGNQPHTTHNQPLQHNSALVLRLSLHPPFLCPLLKALVKWANLLTAGRTPTAGWWQIRPGPWRASVSIRLQRLWPSSTDLFDWAMGSQMGPAGYSQRPLILLSWTGGLRLANQKLTTTPFCFFSIYPH